MRITKPVNLISAISENYGIGKNGNLPWRLRNEMNYFTEMTTGNTGGTPLIRNAVIMGRKTWESIPAKYKPLDDRFNVVVTKQKISHKDVTSYTTLIEAIHDLSENFPDIETIWIIGGSGIYKEAVESKICDRLYITHIKKHFECDVFFPQFLDFYKETAENGLVTKGIQEENGIQYEFKVYERK